MERAAWGRQQRP